MGTTEPAGRRDDLRHLARTRHLPDRRHAARHERGRRAGASLPRVDPAQRGGKAFEIEPAFGTEDRVIETRAVADRLHEREARHAGRDGRRKGIVDVRDRFGWKRPESRALAIGHDVQGEGRRRPLQRIGGYEHEPHLWIGRRPGVARDADVEEIVRRRADRDAGAEIVAGPRPAGDALRPGRRRRRGGPADRREDDRADKYGEPQPAGHRRSRHVNAGGRSLPRHRGRRRPSRAPRTG